MLSYSFHRPFFHDFGLLKWYFTNDYKGKSDCKEIDIVHKVQILQANTTFL